MANNKQHKRLKKNNDMMRWMTEILCTNPQRRGYEIT